jgi:transcriptional regulator with XRE-family HTH domain
MNYCSQPIALDMTLAQAFGQVFKQLREKAGLTQDEVGARAGYSREYINMLERGRKQPSLTAVFNLSDTLGIPTSEVVKRIERLRKK